MENGAAKTARDWPNQSEREAVRQRAQAFVESLRVRDLTLSRYSVSDERFIHSTTAFALEEDDAKAVALERFASTGFPYSDQLHAEVADVIDVEWLVEHCMYASDVERIAQETETMVRADGREAPDSQDVDLKPGLRRTTLRRLCEGAGIPYRYAEPMVWFGHGGGHRVQGADYYVDLDFLRGETKEQRIVDSLLVLATQLHCVEAECCLEHAGLVGMSVNDRAMTEQLGY